MGRFSHSAAGLLAFVCGPFDALDTLFSDTQVVSSTMFGPK